MKQIKWITMGLVGLILCVASPVFGQIKLYPLAVHQHTQPTRIEEDTIYLRLPFFDDFSGYTGKPTPKLWKQGGGTWINNSYAVAPPSLNIATFDGTDANGLPYNFVEPRTADLADELISQPIDLSDNTPTDDIFVSFYWQAEGLGDVPDSIDGDFLHLEFLNQNGDWVEQWKTYGQADSGFRYVILPIVEEQFLHPDFRFRFQSFNRLSGTYDIWNVDYIYIDKDRTLDDKFVIDIAISSAPTPYLKNYQAMPIQQFFANEKAETSERITAIATNLHDNFNVINYQMILRETLTGDTLGVLKDTSSLIEANEKYLLFATTPQALPQDREKIVLEYDFLLNTGNLNPVFGVNLRQNDTVSARTVLDNYYAYDDGSAEFGVGIQQRFGKLAYQFTLNQPDVLTHIDLMFVRLGEDLTGETFNLYIWKTLDTQGGSDADSVLLVQNVIIKYPENPNELERVKLSRPLPLSGSFYIGFEQLNEIDLTFGFDRNTNSIHKAYYNVSNRWEQNLNLFGSIMMRPVFDASLATSVEQNSPILSPVLYPNPTGGTLFLKGNIKTAQIFDLAGKIVLQKSFHAFETTKQLDFPTHLPNGMYILHLKGEKQTVVKKCILRR